MMVQRTGYCAEEFKAVKKMYRNIPNCVTCAGSIQTVPIGYISSCFFMKNGTPRQPTICSPSKAELRIKRSVFNNPEHALLGLEQYSHVW